MSRLNSYTEVEQTHFASVIHAMHSSPTKITVDAKAVNFISDLFADLRDEWNEALEKSGETQPALFIAKDATGIASRYLYFWKNLTDLCEKHELNIDVEPLVEGCETTIIEEGE